MSKSNLLHSMNLVDIVLNMLEGLRELVNDRFITETQAVAIAGINYQDWSKFTSTGKIPITTVLKDAEKTNSRAINLLLSYVKYLRKQHENGFKRIKETVQWEKKLGDNEYFSFQFGHDNTYVAIVQWNLLGWSMTITGDHNVCYTNTLPADLSLEDSENALNYATNELIAFLLKTMY